MKSNPKMGLTFCILLFVISGCAKKQEAKKEELLVPVRVMKVELKDIQKTLDYAGNIEAQDQAQVYPKVSGKIIEKVKEDGSNVNKGDVIAYIDRDEVGLQFEKAPVESPLTGVIGRVYVDKGTNVNPQTPLALVVDIDKVEIKLYIPEKYLPKICIGQITKVSVDAYPGEIFEGNVSKISPVVDLETRTAPIEIIIDNKDHRLKPGMFTKVRLILEEHKNVPVIFKEAIMGKVPDLYVYVIENKKAVLKKITTGIRQGNLFEVTGGMNEGDMVVVMGQQKLRDGVSVYMTPGESS